MSSLLSEDKVSSESANRPAVTIPARRGCGRSADGTAFPADAPYRSLFVGARATGVLLAVTLIALSVMAVKLADLPGRWLSAMGARNRAFGQPGLGLSPGSAAAAAFSSMAGARLE